MLGQRFFDAEIRALRARTLGQVRPDLGVDGLALEGAGGIASGHGVR
jgi:hypothetical protein